MIEVQNLEKSYGAHHVLKNIHFQASPGEIIGVIGKNGAGKSTFLEILMTLKGFDKGEVSLFNTNIQSLSMKELMNIRQKISVVLQPTQFYKKLKVGELLKLFQTYYHSPVSLEEITAQFKLGPHLKQYFDKLSGGWKQIVSLAIAFLAEPCLLILDEPTTGLDPHMRNQLWQYIKAYNQDHGGTVILTTHNMDEIELYCDKVMLINEGVTATFDSIDAVLAKGYSSIHAFYLEKVSI